MFTCTSSYSPQTTFCPTLAKRDLTQYSMQKGSHTPQWVQRWSKAFFRLNALIIHVLYTITEYFYANGLKVGFLLMMRHGLWIHLLVKVFWMLNTNPVAIPHFLPTTKNSISIFPTTQESPTSQQVITFSIVFVYLLRISSYLFKQTYYPEINR